MNISTIEKELSAIWKEMAAPSQAEGEQAVTRACVHNLIIYAPGPNSDTEISSMMVDVTVENPGRVIVLLEANEGDESSAWVTAQCHLRSGGRKQVCCEQIMIRLSAKDPSAPSIVRALLVPDVPVYIWWRAAPEPDTVFLDLIESADRMIIDSALVSGDEFSALQTIGRIIERDGDWLAVSDMNWARLTPWRTAIAELFDSPQQRPLLYDIASVVITQDDSSAGRSLALLLSAWLAGCLDWNPNRKSGNDKIEFQRQNSAIEVKFQTNSANTGSLQRVEIATSSGARIVIEDGSSGHLRGAVQTPGQEELSEVIAAPALSEAAFLNRELEIVGRDVMYEKAIRLIQQLK